MRPLPRIPGFREQPAKLVERPRVPREHSVRVLVDETDRAQYFRKWP